MTPDDVRALVNQGESLFVDFKRGRPDNLSDEKGLAHHRPGSSAWRHHRAEPPSGDDLEHDPSACLTQVEVVPLDDMPVGVVQASALGPAVRHAVRQVPPSDTAGGR